MRAARGCQSPPSGYRGCPQIFVGPPALLGDASLEDTSALCVKYHSSTSHSQSIQIPGVKLGGCFQGFGGSTLVWLHSEWSCHDLPWILLILQQFNSAASGKFGACVRRGTRREKSLTRHLGASFPWIWFCPCNACDNWFPPKFWGDFLCVNPSYRSPCSEGFVCVSLGFGVLLPKELLDTHLGS